MPIKWLVIKLAIQAHKRFQLPVNLAIVKPGNFWAAVLPFYPCPVDQVRNVFRQVPLRPKNNLCADSVVSQPDFPYVRIKKFIMEFKGGAQLFGFHPLKNIVKIGHSDGFRMASAACPCKADLLMVWQGLVGRMEPEIAVKVPEGRIHFCDIEDACPAEAILHPQRVYLDGNSLLCTARQPECIFILPGHLELRGFTKRDRISIIAQEQEFEPCIFRFFPV